MSLAFPHPEVALAGVRGILTARSSSWDPSYEGLDATELIVSFGSGSGTVPEYSDYDRHVARRRGLPELPQRQVRVTFLNESVEQTIRGLAATSLRREQRRLLSSAVRRGAEVSATITAADFDWREADYDYLPSDPFEEPALLTDEAGDRVRAAWVDAWMTQVAVAFLAFGGRSRTPKVAIELLERLRVAIRSTLGVQQDYDTDRLGVPEPLSNDPVAITVMIQTAPHGPDGRIYARPIQSVRGVAPAA